MFIINDAELDRLAGQMHVNTCIYLYLRRYMDYATGIVGIKRGISWQSIKEGLYIEPRRGVKSGSPHKESIRRAVEQLKNSGLVVQKPSKDFLIFKLPLATLDNRDHKKADTNPTPHPDTSEAAPDKDLEGKADTPKNAKADTPLRSESLSFNNHHLSKLPSMDLSTGQVVVVEFSNLIKPENQKAISKYLEKVPDDLRQIMLDDLTGYMSHQSGKGKPVSNPIGIMRRMVERQKDGLYVPELDSLGLTIRKQKKRELDPIAQSVAPKKPPPEGAKKALREQIAKMKGKKHATASE